MQSLQGSWKILAFYTFLERSCKKMLSLQESYNKCNPCKIIAKLIPCKIFARNALLARILQGTHIRKNLAWFFQGIQEKCIILKDLVRFLQDPCKKFFSTRVAYIMLKTPKFNWTVFSRDDSFDKIGKSFGVNYWKIFQDLSIAVEIQKIAL